MLKLLFWGFVAYLGYQYYMDNKSPTEVDTNEPTANPDLLTQPQQKFPLEKITDPRVDNANQPWYQGSRRFEGRADLTFFSSAEERDANIMSYGTQEFWSELGSKYLN